MRGAMLVAMRSAARGARGTFSAYATHPRARVISNSPRARREADCAMNIVSDTSAKARTGACMMYACISTLALPSLEASPPLTG